MKDTNTEEYRAQIPVKEVPKTENLLEKPFWWEKVEINVAQN